MAVEFLAQLYIIRERIAQQLADMDQCAVGGKANIKSSEGGTVVDHVQYRESLWKQLMEINDQINKEESQNEPAEVRTTGLV